MIKYYKNEFLNHFCGICLSRLRNKLNIVNLNYYRNEEIIEMEYVAYYISKVYG